MMLPRLIQNDAGQESFDVSDPASDEYLGRIFLDSFADDPEKAPQVRWFAYDVDDKFIDAFRLKALAITSVVRKARNK